MSSIKEIARLSGVSAATVSRVLNDPNHRCSSEEVRERIWRVAREQGYLPNEAARSLRRGTDDAQERAVLVDVLFTRMRATQADPFFNELFRHVNSEVHARRGIVANVWHETAFSDARRCRKAGADRLVAGLAAGDDRPASEGLVILGKCAPDALECFSGRYRAVVSINRQATRYLCDEVCCDGRLIARKAVEHLHDLGHRRIGYAGSCPDESMYEGYQETLARLGLNVDPGIVFPCEHDERSGYEIMDGLLGRDDAPSALFCVNDLVAIGMIQRLARSRGPVRGPSLIGVDDIEEGQFVRPMLTTIALPKAEMARMAVWLLMDRIEGGHANATCVQYDCRLVERESCTAQTGPDSIEYII